MQGEVVSLKVDPTLVTSVLQKQIQAAIVSQLGNEEELIGHAVRLALSAKVDSKGCTDSRYESDKKYDFLEHLTTKSIHEAAREALKEWLEENKGKIREAVLKELDSPERQKSIAKAYADAIELSLSANWRMDCNINFTERAE